MQWKGSQPFPSAPLQDPQIPKQNTDVSFAKRAQEVDRQYMVVMVK